MHKWLLQTKKKLKCTVVCPPVLLTQHTTISHQVVKKIPLNICKVTVVHQEFLHFPSADSRFCEVARFHCNATHTPSICSFFWQLC